MHHFPRVRDVAQVGVGLQLVEALADGLALGRLEGRAAQQEQRHEEDALRVRRRRQLRQVLEPAVYSLVQRRIGPRGLDGAVQVDPGAGLVQHRRVVAVLVLLLTLPLAEFLVDGHGVVEDLVIDGWVDALHLLGADLVAQFPDVRDDAEKAVHDAEKCCCLGLNHVLWQVEVVHHENASPVGRGYRISYVVVNEKFDQESLEFFVGRFLVLNQMSRGIHVGAIGTIGLSGGNGLETQDEGLCDRRVVDNGGFITGKSPLHILVCSEIPNGIIEMISLPVLVLGFFLP